MKRVIISLIALLVLCCSQMNAQQTTKNPQYVMRLEHRIFDDYAVGYVHIPFVSQYKMVLAGMTYCVILGQGTGIHMANITKDELEVKLLRAQLKQLGVK